ncbi:hypothetical protein B0H11DRAFT_1926648 [Mycena galericulata]|nr:hypothetical protein B0H11DRAFT_1926648 [Mycena galericulata]
MYDRLQLGTFRNGTPSSFNSILSLILYQANRSPHSVLGSIVHHFRPDDRTGPNCKPPFIGTFASPVSPGSHRWSQFSDLPRAAVGVSSEEEGDTTATRPQVLNRRTGVEGGCTGCCALEKGIEVKNEDEETDLVESADIGKNKATTATSSRVLNRGAGGEKGCTRSCALEKGIEVKNEDDETDLVESADIGKNKATGSKVLNRLTGVEGGCPRCFGGYRQEQGDGDGDGFKTLESRGGRREGMHAQLRRIVARARRRRRRQVQKSGIAARASGGNAQAAVGALEKGIEVKNEDDETDLVNSAYHRKSKATATATISKVLNRGAGGEGEIHLLLKNEDDETDLVNSAYHGKSKATATATGSEVLNRRTGVGRDAQAAVEQGDRDRDEALNRHTCVEGGCARCCSGLWTLLRDNGGSRHALDAEHAATKTRAAMPPKPGTQRRFGTTVEAATHSVPSTQRPNPRRHAPEAGDTTTLWYNVGGRHALDAEHAATKPTRRHAPEAGVTTTPCLTQSGS